jgi:hypothetical protein
MENTLRYVNLGFPIQGTGFRVNLMEFCIAKESVSLILKFVLKCRWLRKVYAGVFHHGMTRLI